MQYSPKLKKVMEEIKEILLKHDIAATVALHTPGYAEYLNHITPSYSCATIDELNGKFALKAKKEHFLNEAERINKLSATSNMLNLLSDVTAKNVMNLIQASEVTDVFLNANHEDGGNTSTATQNN